MEKMRLLSKLVICASVFSFGAVAAPSSALAESCESYSEAPSSSSATTFTIIDTEVGTDAYQRLVGYGKGGHKALGMAIAGSYDYFGKCQYVGIGVMDGSGGNGYRPNFTLAIWHEGIDVSKARGVIYALIGADSNPTVTNGDCNISCDGSNGRQFDGSTTTTEVVTTTTVAPEQVQDAVGSPEPQEEAPAQVATQEPYAESLPQVQEQKVEVVEVAISSSPVVNGYVNKKVSAKSKTIKRKKALSHKKVLTK
jgi:hypothetical protein